MYISCLLIDVGDNPDRPRPGRLWLRNLYHVHQRLCMAFPSSSRKCGDPEFLAPFAPEDFGNQHVHVKREAASGFLFRIDPQPGGRAVILVQSGSAAKPDWSYAFQNAGYLLAADPEIKEFNPCFAKGQRLRFRLAANPTKKIGTISKAERQNCTKEELIEKNGRHGKRVPVLADQLFDWLARHAESAGFSVREDFTSIQLGYVYVQKGRDGGGNRLRSVRYEGVLEVTDPEAFRSTLLGGIGPGKAFGFGLLSVAPCSTPLTAKVT